MQEVCGANPPVVIGTSNPSKSRVQHYCSLKHGSKLKYLKFNVYVNYSRLINLVLILGNVSILLSGWKLLFI